MEIFHCSICLCCYQVEAANGESGSDSEEGYDSEANANGDTNGKPKKKLRPLVSMGSLADIESLVPDKLLKKKKEDQLDKTRSLLFALYFSV